MRKLALVLDSPRNGSPAEADVNGTVEAFEEEATASIVVGENGSLKVLSRSQEYRFTSEGFQRAPSQSLNPTQSPEKYAYLISEKSIRILRTLGRGASSVVYKALYTKDFKYVAVKKINCFDKEKRSQMLKDVKALSSANGPGLVHFYGAYHSPEAGQIAIVLEYMDGGSLADILLKAGKIPEPLLAVITVQVLQGLSHLHRHHTVHRDIKPANILLDSQGKAKIADFGISAFVDNTLAVCQTFLGTVTYMSPERINSRPYSYPSDIWSLGLVLVECAMGRYPYDAQGGPLQLMIQVIQDPAPTPPESEYSEEFRDFVRSCLHKDPFSRPTAEQLMKHPFIEKNAVSRQDNLQKYIESHCNSNDRLEGMVMEAVSTYYQAVSEGRNAISRISELYTKQSRLLHEVFEAKSQPEIVKTLANAADLHAAFGTAKHTMDTMDVQPLEDGAFAHVTGHIEVRGVGPLGAAMGEKDTSSAFAEAFIIRRGTNNKVKIMNQMFKML
eukprot:jgi/Botrbrau1/4108/Bobra.152_3s0056.1